MPRRSSLTAQLFAATVIVALAAVGLGGWLYLRAVARVELSTDVTIVRGPGEASEIRREQIVTGGDPRAAEVVDGRLMILFAAIVIGAGAVTFAATRRTLAPLRDLHSAAAALAAGHLSARVPERGAQELASLAHAFNAMAERLDADDRLKRALTNDVAHELRTPLTNLRCHLDALADGVVQVDDRTMATLRDDVQQLERLVEDLGVLALADTRALPLHPEAVDVPAMAAGIAREVAPRAAAAGLNVSEEADGTVPAAWIDPGRLRQVLNNLVDNAITHTPPGGRIAIGVAGDAESVRVSVADTGTGIDADHLPHVFDRFYRADASRSRRTGGVGLGLAIARQLVIASGGRIDVESAAGRGTTFRVVVPAFRA